jgi:hypothetical protein
MTTVCLLRAHSRCNSARQEADLFIITGDMAHHPAVARLRARFVTRVRRDGSQLPGLARVVANEAYVQRYGPGALGVSPHVDSKRFAVLVASFTIEGSARSPSARPGPARSSRNGRPAPAALPFCAGRAC